MNYIPQEISMIISSDSLNGATNKSVDGSSFTVNLQDGLKIPKTALNVNITVEESTIWWVINNIKEGVNDKMYITGPTKAAIVSNTELGYENTVKFSIANEFLTITAVIGVDSPMPTGIFQVGDVFRVDSGVLAGNSYTITAVTSDGEFTQSFVISPDPDIQANGVNTFSRIRSNGDIFDFVITIPQGLYDVSSLNNAIARQLELADAQISPDSLISLSADEATQKTILRFNYSDTTVDFTKSDTFREILGFNSAVYPLIETTPVPIIAPNLAAFNQVNYFLIHSDLVNSGIRFNNSYNQTLAQVLITVPAGRQIVSTPFNPAKVNADELAGVLRTTMKFWLTDDRNRLVNTNGETWGCRILITYLAPI